MSTRPAPKADAALPRARADLRPSGTPPQPRRRTLVAYALVAAVAAASFAFFQFRTPDLVDCDAYYHIKYSYLLRTQGWQWRLPWLEHTIYRDFYRDHHFLYHLVVLQPFTWFGRSHLLVGAKVAAVACATAMALAFFALLRGAEVPRAWLWTMALAGSGTAFLFRMEMTRPMAGAVALVFLAMLLLVKGRRRALGALTAVAVWYYDGYGMIVLVAVLFFAARRLTEGRWDWRTLLWCLGGAAAGIILNPYFLNTHRPFMNVRSYAFNLYRSFSGLETRAGGGSEWYALDAWSFVVLAPGATLGMLVAALAGRWAGRPRADTVALVLAAAVAALMAAKARRYMEYYPPLAVLAAAFTARDLTAGAEGARAPAARRRAALVLNLLLLAPAAFVLPHLSAEIRTSQDHRTFQGAAAYLAENSRPGDLVFNVQYDDFPQLFFYNDRNHYTVGLDPIYLLNHDAELFRLWKEIGSGIMLDPHDALKNRFKARWVVFEKKAGAAFLAAALRDIRARKLVVGYADEFVMVYEVM